MRIWGTAPVAFTPLRYPELRSERLVGQQVLWNQEGSLQKSYIRTLISCFHDSSWLAKVSKGQNINHQPRPTESVDYWGGGGGSRGGSTERYKVTLRTVAVSFVMPLIKCIRQDSTTCTNFLHLTLPGSCKTEPTPGKGDGEITHIPLQKNPKGI